MNIKVDISDVRKCLLSGELDVQVAALKEAQKLIDEISELAVSGLLHADNPLIYADRLFALGPSTVPHLEALYGSSEHGYLRTCVAMLLLSLGSRSGVEDVLEALNLEDQNQFLAANKLASAGIKSAIGPIENLLRTYVFTKPLDDSLAPKIGSFINALKILGAEIPTDIREHLDRPGVSKFITAYLRE